MTNTLYSLSLTATCLAIDLSQQNVDYVKDIDVINSLPKSLRLDVCKELKQVWMKKHPLPLDRFEYRYLNFNQLDKYEFIMLVNHPNETHPEFWPSYTDNAHVYYDYYEYWIGGTASYVLCRQCFIKTSCPSDDDDETDYDAYWKTMNWQFFYVTNHFKTTPGGFIKNILKSEASWCDCCILTPLFELYNWESCRANTKVHAYDNDSDSSDNSSIVSYERQLLFDPYVC